MLETCIACQSLRRGATGGGGGGGARLFWWRISAFVCLLLVLSLVFICFIVFNPGGYRRWHCPQCAHTAMLRLAADTTIAVASSSAAESTPSPTNLSHIVFCIGGSAAMWNRRRVYSTLWWRPEETRGHIWLDVAPPKPVTVAGDGPPYRVSADASRFGKRAAASRMARIVAESYQLHSGDASVRWFVMGDDDTVFFADNLVATLGKYDHDEAYYVGAPSESVEQDVTHSFGMAFGGGGFAVSAPAAADLARVIDGCLERYASLYGSDERVHSCLSELGVPLTREPGFHQGNAYGMLAAHPIAPLVSLHHLDHLDPISPRGRGDKLGALRSLINASRFDPARVVQQCFCYEAGIGFAWSVSISWGYTAQLYARAVPAKDLEVPLRTFKTWRSNGDGPFTFNTRPLRHNRPCDRPQLYFLSDLRNASGGDGTVSEYLRHPEDGREQCWDLPGHEAAARVETINVFAPKMDLAAWRRVGASSLLSLLSYLIHVEMHQAPRRQCCQTRQSWSGRALEVQIRNCQVGDITTPP